MLFATTDYMSGANRKRASRVIENAGPECLPFLIARLRVRATSRPAIALRHLAYSLRLVNSVPAIGSYSDVQRVQAVTALLLRGVGVPPPVPELVVLASNKRSEVSLVASYVLREIAPEDFQRLKTAQRPSGN